jgi:four helix bundle protein
MAQSFSDLRVWREGMNLTIAVYRLTAEFPKHELFGLTQQMRRAAVSIPRNIAEGKGRWSGKEFKQFLFHARGSLLELQTQLMIARELEYLPEQQSQHLFDLASRVGRSLSGLINSLAETAA